MKRNISAPTFAKTAEFGRAITDGIKNYFESQKNKRKTGDWRIWHKTIILFLALAGIYVILVFGHSPPIIKLPLCALMGLVTAAIGFNVMHDAAHKSYSKNKVLNYLMSLSLNLVGGIILFWKEKHNNLHHPNTNIPDWDEDIEAPLLRFHPAQSWKPIYRFQWLYWPLLYGMIYFSWIFINDFKKYFRKKIMDVPFKISVGEHFVFWITKIWYGYIFVYIPVTHVGWTSFLVGYGVMTFVCGIFIAVVFQLAHVVEEVEQPTQAKAQEEERIYHQIATTANFATNSRFFGWVCGGLNYQVEHHIVPHVSHVHYPALSKVVKKVCDEYQVRYHEYKTFVSALRSHIRLLKRLGVRPIYLVK